MISNAEGNSQCHPVIELSNERTDRPYEDLLTLFVGKICVPPWAGSIYASTNHMSPGYWKDNLFDFEMSCSVCPSSDFNLLGT